MAGEDGQLAAERVRRAVAEATGLEIGADLARALAGIADAQARAAAPLLARIRPDDEPAHHERALRDLAPRG